MDFPITPKDQKKKLLKEYFEKTKFSRKSTKLVKLDDQTERVSESHMESLHLGSRMQNRIRFTPVSYTQTLKRLLQQFQHHQGIMCKAAYLHDELQHPAFVSKAVVHTFLLLKLFPDPCAPLSFYGRMHEAETKSKLALLTITTRYSCKRLHYANRCIVQFHAHGPIKTNRNTILRTMRTQQRAQ